MRKKAVLAAILAAAMTAAACSGNGGQSEAASSAEEIVSESQASAAEESQSAGEEEQMSAESQMSSEEEEFVMPEIPEELTGGSPWLDSCVAGNVTADTETSPKDDLYLYVNKDWYLNNQLPEGATVSYWDAMADGMYLAPEDRLAMW